MSNSSRNNRSKRRKESQEFNDSQNFKSQITKLHPKTKNQDRLIQSIKQNHITITSGAAGVGKSIIALHEAVWMLERGIIDKILYTKPTVNFLEQKGIGFLPGPQPLHSKVLTPNGWVMHKDLNIGDLVCTPDGDVVKVLNIFPKGKKDVYKVTTNKGSSTECCLDHLWTVSTKTNPNKFFTTTTKYLKDNLNSIKFKLPKIDLISFSSEDVPIPPYLLGALIGDGGISDARVRFYNTDEDIINRVKNEALLLNCDLKQSKNHKIRFDLVGSEGKTNNPSYTYSAIKNGVTLKFNNYQEICDYFGITRSALNNKIFEGRLAKGYLLQCYKPLNNCSNTIRKPLKDLGLDGCKDFQKFIPSQYKYNSVETRLEILRGLMDTDGTCKKKGEATFYSISKQLTLDVVEIVKSLGGTAKLRSRDRGPTTEIKGKSCNRAISYECNVKLPQHLNPFYIKRKAERYLNSKDIQKGEYIKSIELLSNEECQCILIDHPAHLYITDNFIVTHNTVDEKVLPLMFPLLDNLEVFVSSGKIKYMIDKKQIEFQLLEYVRGRSLRNCFVFLDESQNVSPLAALTMISRIEESSKLVIAGDPKQADIKLKSNALEDSIYRLRGAESVGIIQFQKEDIVRSSFLKDVISRYDNL